MLPVMLDLSRGPVLLYGSGPAALRRRGLLEAAGATDLRVYTDAAPDAEAIAAALLLFVVGVAEDEAGRVAGIARGHGVPVNVEDTTALCDFYTPSVVRRGDLTIAVSTAGRSPGLARRLREKLETLFGPEWQDRLDRLAGARDGWRASGADMATVTERTNDMIEKEGWL
ncbi:precorrin-2 dehydrogenase/sirohydrochlorin ferrochelatase family protein [Govanella unica]|uniref:precorrin-2 dehydrogenase n=1 Tax=Govanella unica TaxID=2975056 RepID=A0A9X3TWM5_9PROT|nr:NAD(P)-dependent oxidoreductase [Govania unica]MDA5193093.1 siroheme synthase [Govania unica]